MKTCEKILRFDNARELEDVLGRREEYVPALEAAGFDPSFVLVTSNAYSVKPTEAARRPSCESTMVVSEDTRGSERRLTAVLIGSRR